MSKKKYLIIPALFLTATLMYYCTSESKRDLDKINTISNDHSIQNSKKNLNVSILLDLSDRIDTLKYPNQTMQYYLRDQGYIELIAKTFLNHVNNTKIINMDENIQVLFEPEPKDPKINDLASKLKIKIDKNTATKEYINSILPTFVSQTRSIYEAALKENKYLGSDIWSFFKNKVIDQCIKPNHKNILIIITDGYMYHKDNLQKINNQTSYISPELIAGLKINHHNFKDLMDKENISLIPANINLENLNVLVLGINPTKSNVYENEILIKYWTDWFNAMGIKNFNIKGNDLPTYMENIIENTLNFAN